MTSGNSFGKEFFKIIINNNKSAGHNWFKLQLKEMQELYKFFLLRR